MTVNDGDIQNTPVCFGTSRRTKPSEYIDIKNHILQGAKQYIDIRKSLVKVGESAC